MNELKLRKMDEFNLVLPAHEQAFEQHILAIYFEIASKKKELFGLPHFFDEIIPGSSYIHFMAGVKAYETGNEDFYFEKVKGFTKWEEDEYVRRELMEYDDQCFPLDEYIPMFHEDIETVLNFHNLCYVNTTITSPFNPKWVHYIENLPLVEVW